LGAGLPARASSAAIVAADRPLATHAPPDLDVIDKRHESDRDQASKSPPCMAGSDFASANAPIKSGRSSKA
jgi:hypothetical protein